MSEERADYNPNDHMMNLKGKDYLPVAARILWCRRDHPDAIMRTTLVEWDKTEGFAMYRAEVTLPSGGHAEATATQTKKDFPQYVEKCESKALGRALGFLGYGTLAAEEEEPGNPNLSDTPVARPQQARSNGSAPTRAAQPPTPQNGAQGGGDLTANLLARIRDDNAQPEFRRKALHTYFNLADDMGVLAARRAMVQESGLPADDIAKLYDWHTQRLAVPSAPRHEVS